MSRLRQDFLSESNIAVVKKEIGNGPDVVPLMKSFPVENSATFGSDARYRLAQLNSQFIQYYSSIYEADPFDKKYTQTAVFGATDAAVANYDIYRTTSNNAGSYNRRTDTLFGRPANNPEQFGPFRNTNNYKGIHNPHIIAAHSRPIERDPEYFKSSRLNGPDKRFDFTTYNPSNDLYAPFK
jgi:hypothetical protein